MITALQQAEAEAARLSDDNLRSEILRCMRGERSAATQFERDRHALRVGVFRKTLNDRLSLRPQNQPHHHDLTR